MTSTTIRRTRIRPGRELDYERAHARIPVHVERDLRSCGVLSWTIWRDGLDLIHVVETADGYGAFVEAIARLKAGHATWDYTISQLLDESTDVVLTPVWAMDHVGQSRAPL